MSMDAASGTALEAASLLRNCYELLRNCRRFKILILQITQIDFQSKFPKIRSSKKNSPADTVTVGGSYPSYGCRNLPEVPGRQSPWFCPNHGGVFGTEGK